MTESVTVVLSGDPQGKGRPRAAVRGKFATFYTPAKTRTYEGMIRTAAMDAMSGREIIASPVEIHLAAVLRSRLVGPRRNAPQHWTAL
jgi:hypothetical protein